MNLNWNHLAGEGFGREGIPKFPVHAENGCDRYALKCFEMISDIL